MNIDNKTYYINDENGLPDGLPLVALDKIRIEKTKEEDIKELTKTLDRQINESKYKRVIADILGSK